MSRRVSLALKDPQMKTTAKVKFPDELIFLDNIKENNVKEIRLMLRRASANIDINKVNDSGLTVLHQAVLNNSLEIVKLLLENNADINVIDEENWTPLHAAAFMNYYDISEYLLRKGANPTALTIENERPIDLIESTNLALVSLYLNHMKQYEKITKQDSVEADDSNESKLISDIFKQKNDEKSLIDSIKALNQDESIIINQLVNGLFESCTNEDKNENNLDGFDLKCSVVCAFLADDNRIECAKLILNLIISLNIELDTVKTMLKIIRDKNLVTIELYEQWKQQIQAQNDIIENLNEIFQ